MGLVFGTLADKDWRPMLDTLAPLAFTRAYVAPQGGARGAADVGAMAARHAGVMAPSTGDALSFVESAPGLSLIVVAGSIVLVGQARARLLGLRSDPSVAL